MHVCMYVCIYTSQPKYDYEWFCILMTCKQQWPRSSKLSTLHISTIFTHEEDLSAFKTLSLCMCAAAHANAECSNMGKCNRATGECQCFKPFTGAACEKSKLIRFQYLFFTLCMYVCMYV